MEFASFQSTKPKSAQNWQNKLKETLALAPRRAPANNYNRYVALVVMTRSQLGYYGYRQSSPSYSYALEPFIIKANALNLLHENTLNTPQEINSFLDSNKKWIKAGAKMYQQLNPAGSLNLTPEAVSFLNVMQNIGHMYGIGSNGMSMLLSMLAKLEVPVFLGGFYPERIDRRLHILPEPVDIKIDMHRIESKLVLQAGFQNNETFTLIHRRIEAVANNPTWVLMDDHVAQFRDPQLLSILATFPIEIPASQINIFREQYFSRIAQTFPIKSDLVHWRDTQAEPVPRLYLHDDKENILRAELRFSYNEYELPAANPGESYAVETVPDSWDLIRVHRKLEREHHLYQLLTDPSFRLKRVGANYPFGTFQLRAHAHPFDFLMDSVPRLTQTGFEIYGEEDLKVGRVNRHIPSLRVNITSGIDWFDLRTIIEYGDQQISLHDVRKALKRGEHYIKLTDGSVGQIPEEWLEKYRHLWNLAEQTEDGFRVSDFHLPLIDALLEEDNTLQIPADLPLRRERLRAFEQIAPQPLPRGFTGELRPYQKHGYDWLHFLKEYRFGGILADDMGLGKTVQVLAYLQSQREQAPVQNAALLVVPKSLIVNWQRESEKFTPNLRFLEYMGNFRNKDTTIFNDYDIVLTTYGTMLRDIGTLRKYKFSYAVLDKSQAIKDPLAKSAKAARLLNAEHRLVMTGTPVENNTFELWSQFAFLNSGLLGSMDYFKHEFTNPIETGGDEKSAETLRKLVYPFILRRTKEQVAPELPPRTERVVYTEMVPSQKKLYSQTPRALPRGTAGLDRR